VVGRQAELARIDQVLDQARSGQSRRLTLTGEPGVGKSVLLEQGIARAVGMNVLRAQGVQSEAHIPFAGLADLLRPAVFLLDGIPRPQAEALAGALALTSSRAQDRFAIGSATLSLLVAYAELGPMLVAVDDAHWIDGSSADALAFAFRRLVADPVAVLVAVRSERRSVLSATDADRLQIVGLDMAGARELVTAQVGVLPEVLLSRLHKDSGGNPLALLEMARQAEGVDGHDPLDTPLPLSTSVSAIHLDRIRSLRRGAATLVLLAAASDLSDLALLARACRALDTDITDLAEAEDARLVNVTETRVEFVHPLIRTAAYNDASPDQRRKAHRALAGALPDREVDRRAWHLALAALGPEPVACSALAQAGTRALERSAYDVAARAFERSSQLADSDHLRAELLSRAARCAWDAGRPERAAQLIEQTRGLPTDERVSIALEYLRGQISVRHGPVGAGLGHLMAAARRSAPVSADESVMILAEAVQAAFYVGDARAMLRAVEAIASIRDRISSRRAVFFAAMAEGMTLTFTGRSQDGAEKLHLAIRVAADVVASDDPQWHAWTAMCNLWLRETGAGRGLLEEAAGVARSRTALGILVHLLCYLAIDHATADRWPEAEAGFHEVLTLARETGHRTGESAALARLAWLEGRQGRRDACLSHAEESLAIAAGLGLRLCEIWVHAALGELHLAHGETGPAVQHLTIQQTLMDSNGIADVDLSPAPDLVEARLRSNDGIGVADLAEAYQKAASEKGLPWALARAARARGLVAPVADMDDLFEEAIRTHNQTPDSFETARTQLAYGSRLRRSRQRVRAREQLRPAIDTFDRLGAAPWAAQARTELAATGEKARARNVTTRDGLTPQELQVALLLSAGQTTRQAASAMFLSPKTIEYHLRNVYRKLDCRSRSELGAALERTPVADDPPRM
jgi:DNA-binding CsgD family transcriptional regulator